MGLEINRHNINSISSKPTSIDVKQNLLDAEILDFLKMWIKK